MPKFHGLKNTSWINVHFALSLPKKFDSEIYPGYHSPIIRAAFNKGANQCDFAHFGLVPSWAKYIQSKNIVSMPRVSQSREIIVLGWQGNLQCPK